ncbi:hypothetical protein FRAAL4819 [Frankia alni ACN14a]|uniref:VOC domain-containing protein n=1 Tax=Frankia alni (strain DSM 45986 / CECT 9034 / ACN14a) TaxID=326424 RepID=Q0RGC8_FRAAA|nr:MULTISPECIES: hypothetical protein [unclassified Frankia]CAJ63460.1 hypothetical protein FRAAL4819 [Frankia alni ACN14a]
MHVDRIDHLVLTVADVERTVDRYARVLRMTPVTFSGGRRSAAGGRWPLAFGRLKLDLHEAGSRNRSPRLHNAGPAARMQS